MFQRLFIVISNLYNLYNMNEEEDQAKKMASIQKLRALKDGWLDGTGKAPSSEILEHLTQLLIKCPMLPGIVPTPSGGAEFFWHKQGITVAIEPDLSTTIMAPSNEDPTEPTTAFFTKEQISDCTYHLQTILPH